MHVPNVEAPTAEEAGIYPAYPEPLHTGNVRDDDAAVLDDLLQENPEPALPFPSSPGEVRATPAAIATRLTTGTVTLANNGVPQKLLSYDPRRCDLHLFVSPVDSSQTAQATVTATGTPVLGPAAFTILTTIAAASLPAGWYDVDVIAETYGTTAVADNNNMRLVIENAVVYIIQMNSGTAGTRAVVPRVRVYLNGTTNTLRVGTIGAATGTATYAASIVATPVSASGEFTQYSPLLISSDVASLAGESVSAVVDAASSPNFRLAEHQGDVFALLSTASVVPAVKVAWIATIK